MDTYDDIWADFEASMPKKESAATHTDTHTCRCGGYRATIDGFPTCTSCGTVESMYIDDSPEWVNGVSEAGVTTEVSRCGNMDVDTDLFSTMWGTGTIIKTNYNASYAMRRMAKISFHSSMNHKDRALFHAYADIERAAGSTGLNLPANVIKDAKVLYKKFNGDVLTRGAIRTGVKANCVLYACKLNKTPRTTSEIADAFAIPTKDISRTTNVFKNTLVGTPTAPTITKAVDVVPRLLNGFAVDNKSRIQCRNLCKKLEECVPLMSKTPKSIAAAVILVVLGDQTTKNEVCKQCDISMPTLTKIENIVKQFTT